MEGNRVPVRAPPRDRGNVAPLRLRLEFLETVRCAPGLVRWALIGIVVGVAAGFMAILFFEVLVLAGNGFLGAILGIYLPPNGVVPTTRTRGPPTRLDSSSCPFSWRGGAWQRACSPLSSPRRRPVRGPTRRSGPFTGAGASASPSSGHQVRRLGPHDWNGGQRGTGRPDRSDRFGAREPACAPPFAFD